MAHFTFTQVALLLPSNEALRMYEPAVANARAGCHKLTLGCFTEADATRAGLVPVRLALALSLVLSLISTILRSNGTTVLTVQLVKPPAAFLLSSNGH